MSSSKDPAFQPVESELEIVLGALIHAHLRKMSLTEVLVLVGKCPDIKTARDFDEAIAFHTKSEAA